jgi:hypothetical protein
MGKSPVSGCDIYSIKHLEVSITDKIYLFIYGSTAIVGLGQFFSFLILHRVGSVS